MPGERVEQAPRGAAPLPTRPVESLWSRYRPPLLAALPSGAVAGALTAVGFQLDGLGEGADTTAVLATVVLCAVVGVLLAAVAALGAVAAVLLSQRRLRVQRGVGYGSVAAGAGAAVGGVTLLAGIAVGGGDQAWLPIALVVAASAALVAAVAAAVVTALSLSWRRLLR